MVNNLNELFEKKGSSFIKDLFDQYVVITEQIDGSYFAFEKSRNGLEFYKRDAKLPINMIDRTLMQYFEYPINYFENINQSIVDEIPFGYKFGFEYVPNVNSTNIVYDVLPKNKLVLVHASDKKKEIEDKLTLTQWAEKFGVEPPPIIYEGFLNEFQKKEILSFLSTPFIELAERFKTESFVKFIITVLNPNLKKTVLNNDFDKPIEGIVFKFKNKLNNENVLAKLVDPYFFYTTKENSKIKAEKVLEPSNIFYLTLSDMCIFLNAINFNDIVLNPKNSKDVKYIEFISEVFNGFIRLNGSKYKNVDFQLPDFLKREEFDLNIKNIKNKKTLENISKNVSFRDVFKIMLNNFRKIRRKTTTFFNQEMLDLFNKTVRKIETYIELKKTDDLNPLNSEELKKMTSKYVEKDKKEQVQDTLKAKSKAKRVSATEDDKEIKESLLESLISDYKPSHQIEEKTPVNLIIGRFQPFTLAHLEICKKLYEKNQYPVVVAFVRGEKSSLDKNKNPMDLTESMNMFDVLKREYPQIFSRCTFNKTAYLPDIIENLREEWSCETVLIGCGTDRVKGYSMQLNGVHEALNMRKDSGLMVMERTDEISATLVRESAISGDKTEFEKLMPECLYYIQNLLKEKK